MGCRENLASRRVLVNHEVNVQVTSAVVVVGPLQTRSFNSAVFRRCRVQTSDKLIFFRQRCGKIVGRAIKSCSFTHLGLPYSSR